MNDEAKNIIQQIEAALTGVKWNNEDHDGTLFFFPTSTPGAKGVLRAGDRHVNFKARLEYQVFLKGSDPYLAIIDNRKSEILEYKIEKLSKPLRMLTIIDQRGNKSNFKYY